MDSERPLHEAIARCVSIVVYYHHSKPDRDAEARMASEIRTVAKTISEMGIPDGECASRITRPIERELFLRYGPEAAPRVVDIILSAFRGDRGALC
jgi:hypothetical protein